MTIPPTYSVRLLSPGRCLDQVSMSRSTDYEDPKPLGSELYPPAGWTSHPVSPNHYSYLQHVFLHFKFSLIRPSISQFQRQKGPGNKTLTRNIWGLFLYFLRPKMYELP